MPLVRTPIESLLVRDERSYRHIELYASLKGALIALDVPFFVGQGALSNEGATQLLNLACFDPDHPAEVLPVAELAADQLAHAGWHATVARFVAPSRDAALLGEAIASAFDLYLIGRLLGHAPEAELLESQVALMAEATAMAGWDEGRFEQLLESAAARPEQAFEQLRSFLYTVSTELADAPGTLAAGEVLEKHEGHPMYGLLHYFEVPTWVLSSRISLPSANEPGDRPSASEVDTSLREAERSAGEQGGDEASGALWWLKNHALDPLLA